MHHFCVLVKLWQFSLHWGKTTIERQITNISEWAYNKRNDFLMIDILMSLTFKYDLSENFSTIDKIYFASVSPNNIQITIRVW